MSKMTHDQGRQLMADCKAIAEKENAGYEISMWEPQEYCVSLHLKKGRELLCWDIFRCPECNEVIPHDQYDDQAEMCMECSLGPVCCANEQQEYPDFGKPELTDELVDAGYHQCDCCDAIVEGDDWVNEADLCRDCYENTYNDTGALEPPC